MISMHLRNGLDIGNPYFTQDMSFSWGITAEHFENQAWDPQLHTGQMYLFHVHPYVSICVSKAHVQYHFFFLHMCLTIFLLALLCIHASCPFQPIYGRLLGMLRNLLTHAISRPTLGGNTSMFDNSGLATAGFRRTLLLKLNAPDMQPV